MIEHLKTTHSISDPERYEREEREKKMRRIREETPAAPSQRVHDRQETAGAVAESRQTEPGALVKVVSWK